MYDDRPGIEQATYSPGGTVAGPAPALAVVTESGIGKSGDSVVGDEEGEHVVMGRLIRRLRISDPPGRFQELATNVLRTSLGMSAVAWVPADEHEPVVVSGGVDGLSSTSYRLLLSPEHARFGVDRQRPGLRADRDDAGDGPPVRIDARWDVGLAARRQPARRPTDRRPGHRADAVRGVADLHPVEQRPNLRRSQGIAVRHHPGVDRRHRRQGPVHLGPLRARGPDRRPLGGGTRHARPEAERPVPGRPAPRHRQDRHRRRRPQEVGAADPRRVPQDPGTRRDRRHDPQGSEEAPAHPARRPPSS